MKKTIAALVIALFATSVEARFPRGTLVAPPSGNNGGVLLNLSTSAYYQSVNQILNWWATGDSRMTIVSSVNGTLIGRQVWDCPTKCSTPTTYIDTNGELITPVPSDVISMERGWFATVPLPQVNYANTPFGQYANSVWKMKWTGCPAPAWTTNNLGTGGSPGMTGIGSNAATITFGSADYGNIATKITFDATCRANPPKAISIYENQYASNVANGEFWNPDWINAIKPFGYIRLMDVMWTNISGISEMSQLADFDYTYFGQAFTSARGGGSISGGVLTITGMQDSHNTFQIGQKVICIGCTGTITISSLGTGTGTTGTYNLSGASGITVSGQVIMGIPPAGQNDSAGPKGGWHPSIVCSLANLANVNIEYPMPAATSDQMMGDVATATRACLNPWLKIKYSYCNEPFNNAGPFDCYRYVQAFNNNTPAVVDYAGYRGAQLAEIVANVYGTPIWSKANPTGKWHFAVSGQAADSSVAASWISGANAYIAAAPSAYTLQQLVNQVDTAPYWGLFIEVSNITGVTAGATPTVTCSNNFTNGQVIKMWVNGGTMAGVLNGVYATVSNRTSSDFQINIDTTGLTYGGTNNGAMDSTTFKLLDESKARNLATPATYPTQYSYFTQQLNKAALNRTASDPSYGTITYPGGLFAQPAQSGVAVAGSLLDGLQRNALVAQKNGLDLSGYEGGPHGIYTNAVNVISDDDNVGAIEHIVFFMMGQSFDPGVVGDSTNSPPGVYAEVFSQWNSVNGRFPSQFNDLAPQSQYGPWGGLRYLPGDTTNIKWQAILAQNALGPWVDPTPAPTWTATRNVLDVGFGSGGSTTLTCPLHVPSTSMVVLASTWTNNTTTISSASIDGGIGAMTQDTFTANAWSAAIHSKAAVPAGTYTVTITWSGSTTFRNCYAVTLQGLASSTKLSATSGNPQKTATLNVTSGSFIIAAAALSGAIGFATDSTQGIATGTVREIDKQVPDGQASGIAYWSPGPSFSSPLFSVSTNSANGMAAASYK